MRTTSDVTRVCVSTEINGVISVCGDETEVRAIYRGPVCESRQHDNWCGRAREMVVRAAC